MTAPARARSLRRRVAITSPAMSAATKTPKMSTPTKPVSERTRSGRLWVYWECLTKRRSAS